MRRKGIAVLFALLLSTVSVIPCSTFVLKDGNKLVFGRNYDFPSGLGHIHINKKNARKTSAPIQGEKQITWISKYGSISFNQVGREFPYGGINEAGLVIEQMWLDETKYPAGDNRAGILELQWIQYQLDNAATVDEVLASDEIIRISQNTTVTLHFLVCDREGHVASIEYIDGEMVWHKDSNLPFEVLTNSTYDESADYTENRISTAGQSGHNFTWSSLDRFANAADMVNNYNNEKNIINYSFEILNSVSQGEHTQWSIVYDVTEMKIYFKTKSNITIKEINFYDFDFSCGEPDIYANMNDDEISFVPYNTADNFQIIDQVCNNVDFLQGMPQEVRKASAEYPETVYCQDEPY